MAEHRDDRAVVAALGELAGHLDWPGPATDVDVTARALEELRSTAPDRSDERRPVRGRQRVALAAAITAVVVLVGVPSTRTAVADLLGMGGIRITQTGGPLPDLGGALDLGRPVSLDQASRLAPGPLPRPAALGIPTAVFVGEPEGGVTLVWAPSPDLPEVLDFDVGLLITAFPAEEGEPAVAGKATAAGGTVQPTDVWGEPAYWMAGPPHQFSYLDEHGRARTATLRPSGNVLVWAHDGVTYRLESVLPQADALRLAESLPH